VRLREINASAVPSQSPAAACGTKDARTSKYSLDFIFDASARCSASVVFVRGVHLPVSLQNRPLTDLGLPLIPLTFYDRGSSHVYTLHGDTAYVDKYKQHGGAGDAHAQDEDEIFIDFGKINAAIDAARAANDTRECVIKWDGSTTQGSNVSLHETGEVFQISPQNSTGGIAGSYIDVIIHLDAHNEHHINQQTKRDKRGRRRSTSQTTYVRFYRTEESTSTHDAGGGTQGGPNATRSDVGVAMRRLDGGQFSNHQWNAVVLGQVVDAFTDLYELLEIYGTESLTSDSDGLSSENVGCGASGKEANGNDIDAVEDCVVCLSAPRDTASLPCRHLCLCNSCAQELRQHSQTCPVCRAPVHTFLRIRTPGAGSRNSDGSSNA